VFIVIVDDDADIRHIFHALLEVRHKVIEFTSVDAAMAADWQHVDVAIVDLMMPGRAGDELIVWLAATHPHVRRILCTAKDPDGLNAVRFGDAHDILSKPFTADDLRRMLADD